MRCFRPQFQWYPLAYATEIKSIQLHDSFVMVTLESISLHFTFYIHLQILMSQAAGMDQLVGCLLYLFLFCGIITSLINPEVNARDTMQKIWRLQRVANERKPRVPKNAVVLCEISAPTLYVYKCLVIFSRIYRMLPSWNMPHHWFITVILCWCYYYYYY